MRRKVPEFRADEETEAVLDEDLAALDFARFRPAHSGFERKTAQINTRLPKSLLDAVEPRAAARRVPHTRFVREALEMAPGRGGKRD